MQRLSQLIVDKRRAIFIISLVLAIASLLALPTVSINKDLTRYLPADSQALQGLDAMNAEFEETSPLRVMYTGLDEGEVQNVADGLEALDHVSSVAVQEGEAQTPAEGKTLFSVNLAGGTYSDSAKAGLDEVRSYTEGGDVAIAGAVVDVVDQASVLGVTILLALGILMVILFVMCSSWIEPILFLAAIGLAIILNMGTNALLPSVSETTFSIAAVLQLALSMDYSIMLTDRYRQERMRADNPAEAMKNALRSGFSAIASSSFTTIAGMLCLVFMSFAIGRDMGIVLAKGVAFSILSVLFVLPGLMVACDKVVQKSQKPSPKPKLRGLAAFSHRFRYAVLGVAAVLTAVSFVVKGSAGITFFMASSNDDQKRIEEAFPAAEQIVVLYDKNTEAADALAHIGQLEGVESIQSYEGTLGKPLTVEELADATGMDPQVVQLLMYARQNGTSVGDMGANDFATLVADDIAGNAALSAGYDADELAQIDTLQTLSDPEQIEAQRTAAQMADLLGFDDERMQQLYLYYYLENDLVEHEPLALSTFVRFLQDDVLDNAAFASMFDDETRSQVERLALLSDVQATTSPLDAAGLAQALGMQTDQVEQILLFQVMATADLSGYALTVPQVLATLVDDVAADPLYAPYFDESALAQLRSLRALADAAAAGTAYTADELANMLGLDAPTVQQLYSLSGTLSGGQDRATMTLPAFLAFLIDDVANNPSVTASLDPALAQQLQAQASSLATVRAAVDAAAAGTAYNPADMAALLGIDGQLLRQAYLTCGLADGTIALPHMSVQSFLTYVIEVASKAPQLQGSFDEAALAQLEQARAIVATAAAGTDLDAAGLAQVTGMDEAQVGQLLAYRAFTEGGAQTWTANLEQIVAFLANAASDSDSALAAELTDEDRQRIAALDDVVAGALDGAVYTPEEMAALLGRLAAGEFDAARVHLAYLLGDSIAAYDPAATMSLEELVSYAADDVVSDALFADVLDDAARADLAEARATLADAKEQLVGDAYARALVETNVNRDSPEMQRLATDIAATMDATGTSYYLIGDGPLGWEMQERFDSEFNFITVLTAVVVFVIVAATFRSIFVPLILVLLIQTAINLTMGVTALQGIGIYYIALMVVQALLMGATIDYAILFATYYREARVVCNPREALARAYQGSVGTIMTSSSILVLVLLVVGLTSSDVTISEVCLTIAKGSAVAVTLVMLLLPGMMAALDRFVAGPGALRKTGTGGPTDGDAGGFAPAAAARPTGGAHWAAPHADGTACRDGGTREELAWPELHDLAVTPPGAAHDGKR